MFWKKRGLIFCPGNDSWWMHNSVMTPTPVLLDEETIRIYAGFRDKDGISRLGFIDVSSNDPKKILRISKKPIIELGNKGTFDDNGMILGDVVVMDQKILMYYIGFQKINNIKFSAMTGLAISDDHGETFYRWSEVPVMDRADNALFIRAIHRVIKDKNIWRVWYSLGSSWKNIGGVDYPVYHIHYTESKDGINFIDSRDVHCIDTTGNEYRIGRPRVYYLNGQYYMFYTFDTIEKQYSAGMAKSTDGLNWERIDHDFGLERSKDGWDSEMVCYPALLTVGNKLYIFYSGNGMGYSGVGFAELVKF